jgi:hypothetical protein
MQEAGSEGMIVLKKVSAVLGDQLAVLKAKTAELAAWLGDSVHDLLEGKVDWDKVRGGT